MKQQEHGKDGAKIVSLCISQDSKNFLSLHKQFSALFIATTIETKQKTGEEENKLARL